MCTCSILESLCQLLQFSVAAPHQVDVICKPQIVDGSSTDGDGGVEVVEGFAHDVFQEEIEQDWRE